jgi:putative endopeptidase
MARQSTDLAVVRATTLAEMRPGDTSTTPGSAPALSTAPEVQAEPWSQADPIARILSGSTAAPKFGSWGFDLSGRNLSVRPNDDFFEYANGAYMKRLDIPADRSRFGNFELLTSLSQNRVRGLLEEAKTEPSSSPIAKKLGAFFESFLNEERVERLGASPVLEDLQRVRVATTRAKIAELMGAAHKGFGYSLFNLNLDTDKKNPERYAIYLATGGLGLPDRSYYSDPKLNSKKAAYQAYAAELLALIGWGNPDLLAGNIVEFESRVAAATWSRSDRRDQDKTYNPVTLNELQTFAPGMNWQAFMRAADLASAPRIVLVESTSFPAIARVFAETPVETLQAWQAFHLTDEAAPYLADAFLKARFRFRNQALAGQPELAPRWKRAVNAVNANLGEAVGQIYVQRYFNETSKRQVESLVTDLREAFRIRLKKLDWMGPETKAKALEKLAKLNVKIGYPSKPRSFDYRVAADDLYGNVKRARSWDWKYYVGRVYGPLDRTEWGLTPQAVNAYYNAQMNDIVFPAAILQPPYFDPEADAAVNYGAIGATIGHEITHAFDDQGRKSDGAGRLTDWWSAADVASFTARAELLSKQYSRLEPLPGTRLNGQLTLGENIGDLGGLSVALDAYRLSLGGRPAPVIDGLTGEQRLFLAYAQVYRGKVRSDALLQQLLTDSHAPVEARVNSVLRNLDGWYSAFNVQPDHSLYLNPQDRVLIW